MTAVVHTPRVTAGMPLDLLVAKLERAGGGGLSKRQRAALRGLTLLLPHGSAAGRATAGQVASMVGYSGRWMREGLADLEGLGLLEWHRGGVDAGAPQPSVFRVAKDVLCDLVRQGFAAFSASTARRSASTRARLAGLTLRPRQKRRSAHAEVGSYLYPFGEGTLLREEPEQVPRPPVLPSAHVKALADIARQEIREALRRSALTF